jgi:hypothetical protein
MLRYGLRIIETACVAKLPQMLKNATTFNGLACK